MCQICGDILWLGCRDVVVVRRGKGDTWWLNEDLKEVMSGKKDAYKVMCRNST